MCIAYDNYYRPSTTIPMPWPEYKFQYPVPLSVTKVKVWCVFREDDYGGDTSLESIHKTQEGADANCLALYQQYKEVKITSRKIDHERRIANRNITIVFKNGEMTINPIDDSPILSPYWVGEWTLDE